LPVGDEEQEEKRAERETYLSDRKRALADCPLGDKVKAAAKEAVSTTLSSHKKHRTAREIVACTQPYGDDTDDEAGESEREFADERRPDAAGDCADRCNVDAAAQGAGAWGNHAAVSIRSVSVQGKLAGVAMRATDTQDCARAVETQDETLLFDHGGVEETLEYNASGARWSRGEDPHCYASAAEELIAHRGIYGAAVKDTPDDATREFRSQACTFAGEETLNYDCNGGNKAGTCDDDKEGCNASTGDRRMSSREVAPERGQDTGAYSMEDEDVAHYNADISAAIAASLQSLPSSAALGSRGRAQEQIVIEID
jgi:hypothetical protein